MLAFSLEIILKILYTLILIVRWQMGYTIDTISIKAELNCIIFMYHYFPSINISVDVTTGHPTESSLFLFFNIELLSKKEVLFCMYRIYNVEIAYPKFINCHFTKWQTTSKWVFYKNIEYTFSIRQK